MPVTGMAAIKRRCGFHGSNDCSYTFSHLLYVYGDRTVVATAQLHLLSHEHSHEHDFNDCSTCRQLLVSPEKLATGPQIILPDKELCKESIEFIPQFSVTTFHYKSINARPPPFIFSI